jgi:hypothetical protein
MFARTGGSAVARSAVSRDALGGGRSTENDMKTIAKLVLLLSLGIAGVSPAIAGPVCLNSYQVDRTTVLNAKTILFRMKNGTVWRNTLRTSCSGLLFNGFAYTLQTSDICDNLQTIRVLRTGEVCVLGKFSRELPHKG